MGKLIKINIYAEKKKADQNKLKINKIEENFHAYNKWLEETDNADVVENYKKFLSM